MALRAVLAFAIFGVAVAAESPQPLSALTFFSGMWRVERTQWVKGSGRPPRRESLELNLTRAYAEERLDGALQQGDTPLFRVFIEEGSASDEGTFRVDLAGVDAAAGPDIDLDDVEDEDAPHSGERQYRDTVARFRYDFEAVSAQAAFAAGPFVAGDAQHQEGTFSIAATPGNFVMVLNRTATGSVETWIAHLQQPPPTPFTTQFLPTLVIFALWLSFKVAQAAKGQ
eukprot:Hpha_TRINITY_DN31378_c0_g1::TRINITY_DN31378_c0_g1_i1::g.194593::m.194593